MLQEIRIRSLGVIDDAVLELHPGLNVVTGETGAGKTMVVSGLGLLLGARADAGLVRSGARSALVEGIAELPPEHPVIERAQDAGADTSDGLILARSVSAEGRSRAHLGGRTVPVSTLAEIGEQLVAVHGQADQWRLRRPDQHREMLDSSGGETVATALAAYRRAFEAHDGARREIERLRTLAREREQELDVLRFGLEQIEAVDPRPGEDEELRVEDGRLGHAEELRTAAQSALRALAGDDEAYGVDPAPSVSSLLADARSALGAVAEDDPAVSRLAERVAELGYLAADLGSEVGAYAAGVELDPERLAWVQQRRSELSGLTRKYGETVEEVLAWSARAAARVDELMGADDRLVELEGDLARLREELGDAAAELSRRRQAAALALDEAVTGELRHLAMGKAQVEVSVASQCAEDGIPVPGREGLIRYGRSGIDEVEIRLAANPGAPARSVVRAASGGELSRVMLALEVVTGAAAGLGETGGPGGVPTFVFDEVDAGVGGRAALDVGARLAALAEHAQVIVVTHLAQVAAFADRHLVVSKTGDGQVTASDITQVQDEAQERELARLMAGVESETALTHARELRAEAAARRAAGREQSAASRSGGPGRSGRAAPGTGRRAKAAADGVTTANAAAGKAATRQATTRKATARKATSARSSGSRPKDSRSS